MTSDEFYAWKSDPTTKLVFQAIETAIANGKDELASVAGENPISDSRRVGKIQGLEAVLDISFDEVKEVEND